MKELYLNDNIPKTDLQNNFYKKLIYTTLLNIAIFQGIVLGFVILKSSLFYSNSNKYLAFLLLTLSIKLLTHVFEIQQVLTSYPLLRFIDNIEWVFLMPAFLFLFIKNRVDNIGKHKLRNYLYFIPFAFFENKLIGICTFVKNELNIGNIYQMYVKPEFQGHNIGKQLLMETLKEAEKRFSKIEISLEVQSNNYKAIELYEKAGFEKVLEKKENNCIVMKFGYKNSKQVL